MKKRIRLVHFTLGTQLLLAPAPAAAHSSGTHGPSAFSPPAQVVDCTLEDGQETTCYQLTVGYKPETLDIGPFCPATLTDDGGIWNWDGENAGLYRLDEAFLRMLDDLGYRFFDDDGTVHIADIATAQPEQDHACINVSPDDTVTITMLLPTAPVMADTPAPLGVVGKVGVALDGVPIFSDAPSVHQTGHMPALDLCGGHIDPGGWYHWHATASDIQTVLDAEDVAAECALPQDSSALFGFAFDGFAIYGSLESDGSAPEGLDACNGHIAETPDGLVYHYHAGEDFPNLPPCLVGLSAQNNFTTTAQAGVGAHPPEGTEITRSEPPRGQPGGLPPGFEDAAKVLGIPADTLMAQMDAAGGPNADLDVVAKALGVTPEALRDALPAQPRR